MPLSSNTKPGDLGHAQVLRDIEYLYMMIGGGGTEGVGDGQLQDGTNLDPDLGTALSDRAEDGAVGININQRIDRLCKLVDELRRRTYTSATPVTLINIADGNTLLTIGATNLYGVKAMGSVTVVSLPTATPSLGVTYQDGIGCGYLVTPSTGALGALVWVVLATSVNGTSLDSAGYNAAAGAFAASKLTVQLPVSGGGEATAYSIWRF